MLRLLLLLLFITVPLLLASIQFGKCSADSQEEDPILVHDYVLTNVSLSNSWRHSEHVALNFTDRNLWLNDHSFDRSSPGPNCYLLQRCSVPSSPSEANITSVSVEFAFDHGGNDANTAKRQHLFGPSTNAAIRFCLDEFIYLNRMERFHLYITTNGQLTNGRSIEVKLFQVFDGPNTIVQPPNGSATISGGWFFYSAQANVSFTVPEVIEKDFYICDILNNCELMDRRQQQEIKHNHTIYSVSKYVHQTLAKRSPVVRIEGDLHRSEPKGYDASYVLNYNRANERSTDALMHRFRLFSNLTRHSPTSLSFMHKATRESPDFVVTVPMASFDPRLQEVFITATVLNGSLSGSSLRLVRWHCQIPLSPDLSSSFFGFEGLNADTDQLNLTTASFITLGLDELYPPETVNQHLELRYRAVLDDEDHSPALEVRLELTVRSLALGAMVHDGALSNAGGLVNFPRHRIDSEKGDKVDRSNVVNKNPVQLSWTSWGYAPYDHRIQNATGGVYARVKHRYSLGHQLDNIIDNNTLNASHLRVDRLIIGSQGRFVTRKQLRFDFPSANQTTATKGGEVVLYEDVVLYTELPKYDDGERFFRLAYLTRSDLPTLESQVGFVTNRSLFDKAENCKRVPTFAQFNCDEQQFQCLAEYFRFDPVLGSCKRI